MKSNQSEFLSKLESHKGVVFKITKLYSDSKSDSEDLYQEIIYQAWKSYSNFRGDCKFSTWLYRVALNTAMTFIKKEKKRFDISRELPENIKGINDTEDDEKDERLKIMYSAIKQMSLVDKSLIFYFLQDYSGEEMAKELGLSEVNTRVKLNRAKKKLKEIINSKKK